jgi:16S rRNA (guanine527-N7)-methyltransferase
MSMLHPDWLNVSRETTEQLRAFEALVIRWNPAINLVSKASIPHLWERHILDSCQVFDLAPLDANEWIDIGSGGGFPGVVVSILRRANRPNLKLTLVESDQRKCVFLSEVKRQLSLDFAIVNKRIEDLGPLTADILSARALSSLPDLCGYAKQLLNPNGVALFQKGNSYENEVNAAKIRWNFSLDIVASKIDPTAVILRMKDIQNV